ncbi:MAG TPA: carboxypeptidase-like regulatory domain-containing protein [Amnibacterium sp.]|nr:carboxypeptidase-like regulatory domain-containing protein [Amnibacterium sp.]
MSGNGTIRMGFRSRRLFDLVAMLGIGVVIVAAALVPAVTANVGGTDTIRGDVTVSAKPVPFIAVGFWSPQNGVRASTTTDSNGRFTLDVPSNVDGYAYAGTPPDSYEAITDVGSGLQVVRGIIGGTFARPVSTPLYQGWPSATAKGLAGGKDLHFLLQPPGRISGTSPLHGSAVQVAQLRRLDGSVVQTLRLDSSGRFTSEPVAPGSYAVAVVPKAPYLPEAVQADVRGGSTASVTLPSPIRGGTIRGVLIANGKPVTAAVPVILSKDGQDIATTDSTSTGVYAFGAVPSGTYQVTIGRYPDTASERSLAAEPIPILGHTTSPTPTPTPTPVPSPSTSVAGQGTVALQPVERTSDAYVPTSSQAYVPAALGVVEVDAALQSAGRIEGTVTGVRTGTPVQVVAEDVTTRQILRSAAANPATGRYSLGGLMPGIQYRVYAVSRPSDLAVATYASGSGVATQTGTTVDLVLDSPAITLTGRINGATGGSVSVGDSTTLVRATTADSTGGFTVAGLVPAAYPITVTAPGRLASAPVALDITTSTDQNLSPGPKPATYKAWFISSGAGIPRVVGAAASTGGARMTISPPGRDGNVTVEGLRPGDYTYDPAAFLGLAPCGDGPWWFTPPTGTFTLRDGATTDVGPVVLHVRAQ